MASSLLQEMEISASQFLDIFHHYDNDGNGFIEGKELQSFIKELREARQQAGLGLTDHMRQFVSENEETSDRRIGLVELVQILPTEENFLLFFRQQLSSASQFLQTWRRYDADHSGYIEADELKLKIFDSNGDGKLCLAEMARLLPDEQNFLLRFEVLDSADLPLYQASIMQLSDGGKLYRSELALLLCDED
ncbi:hypothetical protein PAMP_002500 [Pampus punctatissimus]